MTDLNVLTTLKETSQGPTNRKSILDACIMSWLGSARWGALPTLNSAEGRHAHSLSSGCWGKKAEVLQPRTGKGAQRVLLTS